MFACSMGDNVIHYLGHVKMVAAVQPFLCGGVSKTVNMPESATVEDIEQLNIEAWRMGVKSIAVYRDNCKVGQPLSTTERALAAALTEVPGPGREAELHRRITELEDALASKTAPPPSARRRLPCHPARSHVGIHPAGLRWLHDGRGIRGRASGRDLLAGC